MLNSMKLSKKKKIIEGLILHIYIFSILIVFYTIMFVLFGGFCPIKQLLGIPCPFCGMSSAYVSCFVYFDLKTAFEFNRVFPLGVPLLSGVVHYKYFSKKMGRWADIFIIFFGIVIFLNYIFTLINHFSTGI